jgi:hypothetical protein
VSNRDVAYALLVIVAILVAAASLYLWATSRPPGDDSPEAGFARDMMVHHAQAVQMAQIIEGKTEDTEIRSLAADIALTQQAQIGQMQGWLDVWGLSPTGTEEPMAWMGHPTDGRMPGMASPEEIEQDSDPSRLANDPLDQVPRYPFSSRGAALALVASARHGHQPKAATPASATSWSSSTVPPLTPIAPITSPSRINGMPPAKMTIRPPFVVLIPKRGWPGWAISPISLVVRPLPAEVKALSMAMSMLATQAPSIRWKATRFLPASVTAMFIGRPISRAFCSAAETIPLAASSVITALLPPRPWTRHHLLPANHTDTS